MCGITGLLYFDDARSVPEATLARMTDVLTHRGPDDRGIWTRGSYGLGFRRLSIIDLSPAGNQPMANETGDVLAVFNGELYNFRELRADLEAGGHSFRSKTDSEVVVHAYEEHGQECLRYFNGMFALAILDLRSHSLLLARDRLGIKPLYYRVTGEGIWFGSELKAILADQTVERTIDPLALNLYFVREVIPAPYTIYQGIQKLRPGELLAVDLARGKASVRLARYWQLHFDPDRSASEAKWVQRLGDVLHDAVSCHLVSDVPLGAFLSGGIDSSSVVALMNQTSQMPVETFTVAFKDQEADESAAAEAVASQLGTVHHEVTVEADSLRILPKLVWHYDEPFGDSSAIPTYLICQEASQFVKVILSGDGGDELFGGYFSQRDVDRLTVLPRIPRGLRLVAPFAGHFLPSHWHQMTRRLSLPNWLLFGSLHDHIFDESRRRVLRPEWRASWDDVLASYDGLRTSLSELEPLNAVLAASFETYLPDDILTKVDRASSAHSLEVRVPLLDYRVAEMAARIPPELKFRGESQKHIFRKVMRPFLPPEVWARRKHGFTVPAHQWGKTIWRDRLVQLRTESPEVGDVIDFDELPRWDGPLIWQVLFLATFLADRRHTLP